MKVLPKVSSDIHGLRGHGCKQSGQNARVYYMVDESCDLKKLDRIEHGQSDRGHAAVGGG